MSADRSSAQGIAQPGLEEAAPQWKWAIESAILTLLLAVAFILSTVIDPTTSSWIAGAIMVGAAGIEAVLASRNKGTREGNAALTLSSFTLAAGLVLFLSALGDALQSALLVAVALLVRGAGAMIASIQAKPRSRNWLACRGCIDLALGGFLLVTVPLAMVVALPFTTLLSLFTSIEPNPRANVIMAGLLCLSSVAAAGIFLVIGKSRTRPVA